MEAVFLLSLLVLPFSVLAGDENADYKNRISAGVGGEDGYLGIDYSRDIYRSKIFLGIGSGFGTGLTAYLRYEPFGWHGLRPFISSGLTHTFGGTLVKAPNASTFTASAGVNYLPRLNWKLIPTIGIGMSYFAAIPANAEGAVNGYSPLIKFGFAFTRRITKSSGTRNQ